MPPPKKALVDILIKRRDKILRTYLPAVNPIVAPRLEDNRLTFENAAVRADVATAPEAYRASWFLLRQHDRRDSSPVGSDQRDDDDRCPAGLPTTTGSFVAVDISR